MKIPFLPQNRMKTHLPRLALAIAAALGAAIEPTPLQAATTIISGLPLGGLRAACTTVKDSSTVAGLGAHSLGIGSSSMYLATKFVAGSSYTFCGFDALLQKSGSPTQTVTPELWSHNAGTDLPDAALSVGSTTYNAATFPASEAAYHFTGMNAALVSGTTYWLVLHITSGASDSGNFTQWFRNSTLAVGGANNVASATAAGSWSSTSTSRRLKFNTYTP